MSVNAGAILRCFARALVASLAGLASAPAGASEGRIEIDQASVNAAGGFPFVIASPGSYVLTSNLTNGSPNTPAISIQAADVTLDLGGHVIRGPASCSGFGAALACINTGGGAGVFSSGARTVVRNGTVRGAGGHGIDLAAPGARVESVRCTENGGAGVFAAGGSAAGAVVTESLFERNGGDGFFGGAHAQAIGTFADGNHAAGIAVGDGGLVQHSYVSDNGQSGIKSIGAGTVRQNVSFGNTTVGAALEFSGNGGYGGNFLVGGIGHPDVVGPAAPNDPDQLAPNFCGADTVCP